MPIWPIQYHILATYQPQVQKKLSIIDRSANPPPIHIQSQYRPMQVSNVRIHWTHWPLALAGIGAGLVVDCQISKVLIPLTLTWICSGMPWTLSICANGFAALGTSATKKRENVGILKKKNTGGGLPKSHFFCNLAKWFLACQIHSEVLKHVLQWEGSVIWSLSAYFVLDSRELIL